MTFDENAKFKGLEYKKIIFLTEMSNLQFYTNFILRAIVWNIAKLNC